MGRSLAAILLDDWGLIAEDPTLISCTLQLPPVHLDTMQPQEIVEEEELERMKALLQRENLIRSLGIVQQLTRVLHPSHRGQKKLHEYRVRVPVQPRTEQGNKGYTSTWWWPQPRRLM